MQVRNPRRFAAAVLFSLTGFSAMAADTNADKRWQENYEARQSYFEANLGPFPQDILKMLNMSGVWPGGGLFVIPADRLGKRLSVYTTFGLTNPDMPTTVQMTDFKLGADGKHATQAEGALKKRVPAKTRPGAAGYGYEIFLVAQSDQQWPLGLLQWIVNAEIGKDVGLLGRVEKYDGLTIDKVDVGPGGPVNVLIAKAKAPLPTGAQLPGGKMELLVATTITDEEMQWAMNNGRGALLQKLQDAGVGQISTPGRSSIVR